MRDPSSSPRQVKGQRGEHRAETWLVQRGLKPVERNYRCRAGEIDLIMLDPTVEETEVLSFVEVRVRGSGALVDGIDSIDEGKQRRLVRAAQHFLMSHPQWSEHACRFDVIGIDGAAGKIQWIAGAFEPESD